MQNDSPTTGSSPQAAARSARRRAGRGRRSDQSSKVKSTPNFIRNIPAYDVLGEDGLQTIEDQADWILAEVGVRFVDDPAALQLFENAGASVDGDRVRFDRGQARQLCSTAPAEFSMRARNPDRSVTMGGNNVVMAPCDCAPFVTDLENGRRYGTLEDHHNLSKLLQLAPGLHHNPAIICEPSDIPVNKRHLDMLYSQFRYTDKPVMGLVNASERIEDSLAMARIVFADEFDGESPVMMAATAVQSPLTFNGETTTTVRRYAEVGQANMITPFIIAGAMSPTTIAGTLAQAHAEAQAGIALAQLIRPGAPVIYSAFVTTMDLRSGAATYGTPESSLLNMAIAQLARKLQIPVRCGGQLTSSKIVDAQALQESMATLDAAVMAGANYLLQCAGWLEGGLTIGYEKFVIDAERCAAAGRMLRGIDLDDNELAGEAFLEISEETSNFLGFGHTMKNFATVNFDAELADSDSFEQWRENGARDMCARAGDAWRKMLADYETPPLDQAIDNALLEFIARQKDSVEDSWY